MKRILLASILAVLTLMGFVQAADFTPIEKWIQTDIAGAQVGIWVQDVNSGEVLYSRLGEQGFTPASITKAFTTAASIIDLPADFNYTTTLYYDKTQLQDHILYGNLGIQFTGDPTLTRSELENLFKNLPGIKTITGNIIIDNSYFPKPDAGRGWVADDLNWYFGAPAQSVIVDENQIPVILTPEKFLGKKIHIQTAQQNLNIPITNEVFTESAQQASTLCQLNVDLNPDNNAMHFYGCWPENAEQKPTILKVAVANPGAYASQIIQQTLASQGIQLRGLIKTGHVKSSDMISSHQSPPLSSINAIVMQQSNNIYADSLAKVLGKKNYQFGTLQTGSYAIIKILENKLKIDLKNIRLNDGSGMSIYNQITPHSVAILLQAMYQNPQYQDAYLNSMEVIKDQHHFYHRMPENVISPFYTKTGAMTGVSNMAGYLKTHSGKTLGYVCLLNQLPLNKNMAREFERKLLEHLTML